MHTCNQFPLNLLFYLPATSLLPVFRSGVLPLSVLLEILIKCFKLYLALQVGFRIEHPQVLIDSARYGPDAQLVLKGKGTIPVAGTRAWGRMCTRGRYDRSGRYVGVGWCAMDAGSL